MQLLQCTARLPRGTRQWKLCNALPHCLGAMGDATPAMHCRTTGGQGAVALLQCKATLPGGRWAAEPATHSLTARAASFPTSPGNKRKMSAFTNVSFRPMTSIGLGIPTL